jgi:putative SOS response-associated peptidase YedK
MCYSAQIWADFRKYERLGGKLDIGAFTRLAGWTKSKGSWIKQVPKAMRRAMMDPGNNALDAATIELARQAEAESIAQVETELAAQEQRLARAQATLASARPTKKAQNEVRVAGNKIAAARKKLLDLPLPPRVDGIDRIHPGDFAPVLIRDAESGARMVVPMRYRCRVPGWTAADELAKPGTYCARRDSLSTVWRRVFGVHHGIVAVRQFYERVQLHDHQQRALAPGETEQSIELLFTPHNGGDLFIACLWTYVEASGDEPGFYSFALITDHPPPEVALAGHDRCIMQIREEDIEDWLRPVGQSHAQLQAILDRGEAQRPYFDHEIC